MNVLIFFATKIHIFATIDFFYPLFLNEGSKIRKNRPSKHDQYQRYTCLIKTVQLESQCLQSYDAVFEFFGQFSKQFITN
jgi:hypothetical protein